MTTKFDQACNVIHCLLKALDLNGFTPNLTSNLCSVEFDRALNTGQIGWKFTEITLYACLVEWGIISMDLHPI